MTNKDLKEGQVYYGEHNQLTRIFRFKEFIGLVPIVTSYLRTSDQSFSSDFGSIQPGEFRLATPDEIRWIEACEKAGKFIPKEEVMKQNQNSVPGSLVGRYLKCIKARTWISDSKTGDFFKITREESGYVWCDGFNGFSMAKERFTRDHEFELMPEGFKPGKKESPAKFEVGKWYTHPKWNPGHYIKFHSIRDYNSVNNLESITNKIYNSIPTWSITYDKSRDKISLSRFTFGYGYKSDSRVRGTPGNLTGRIYPFKRNVPLLCLTDRVWAFAQIKKGKRYSYKPRVYTGRLWQPELTEYLRKVLDCSESVLRLNMSYKYLKGYRYEAQAMHRRFPGVISDLVNNQLQNPTKEWDHNWLITTSGNQPRELLKMVSWRALEDLIPHPEDKYNVWWSSADFLCSRPVQNTTNVDGTNSLPF